MLQIARFLLVLVAVSQSAALSISVSDPLVPGQTATTRWTRTANEPSSYFAVLHSQSGATRDLSFPVSSNGQLSWELSAKVPPNLPTGSYVLFAYEAHSRNPLATSNIFTVGASVGPASGAGAGAGGGAGAAAGAATNAQTVPLTSASQTGAPPTSPTSPIPPFSAQSAPGSSTIPTSPTDTGLSQTSTSVTPIMGGSSSANTNDPLGTTASPSLQSTADANAATSSPTNTAPGIAAASSSSNKAAVIGGVIGALLAVALIAIITVIIVRRYRRKQDTVQFYENKMVRPRDQSNPLQSAYSYGQPSHSYGTVNTAGHSYPNLPPQTATGYPQDTKMEPEPLPAYGYSNIDIVEKADYYRHPYSDAGTSSPRPNRAMPR